MTLVPLKQESGVQVSLRLVPISQKESLLVSGQPVGIAKGLETGENAHQPLLNANGVLNAAEDLFGLLCGFLCQLPMMTRLLTGHLGQLLVEGVGKREVEAPGNAAVLRGALLEAGERLLVQHNVEDAVGKHLRDGDGRCHFAAKVAVVPSSLSTSTQRLHFCQLAATRPNSLSSAPISSFSSARCTAPGALAAKPRGSA
ncbi:MAG: hypothetical protein BJ554DRAFT_4181 [Olpidium bornovanus]|uniref:Uncharacterized protein n=1 Tax=Olpidium bornovanus TaxID=278681 RepID=A0A8H8DF97_9FUNG|nr:MAG: hypothetical protein BJ554DRAFT_4181 [Olpidium bornovanus]